MRRKTNHDNVTNQKHGNTYNRRYQTWNNYGNHEHVSMPNKPPADYDRRNYHNSNV